MRLQSLFMVKRQQKSAAASEALFGQGSNMENVPMVTITADMANAQILDVLVYTKILPSKGEGRRLIQQGGLTLNDVKVDDFTRVLTSEDFKDGFVMIKKGKKKFYKLSIE